MGGKRYLYFLIFVVGHSGIRGIKGDLLMEKRTQSANIIILPSTFIWCSPTLGFRDLIVSEDFDVIAKFPSKFLDTSVLT